MNARALLPSIVLDACAMGWVLAAILAINSWAGIGVAPWLLILAYILPAASRRLSLALGFLTLAAVGVAAALLADGAPFLACAVLAIVPGLRAVTLEPKAPYWAVRAEFQRGLLMFILIALLRGIMEQPPASELLPFAALLLIAGVLGLPLVHSHDALGGRPEYLQAALPGVRLGGLILAASGGLGLLVAGVRWLYLTGRLAFLDRVLWPIIYPFLYVAARIASYLFRLLHLRRPSQPPAQKQPPAPKHPKLPTHVSPSLAQNLHLLLVLIAAAILVAIVYGAYARAKARAASMNPLNALDEQGDLRIGSLLRPGRRRPDYGTGARRRVRSAVGQHIARGGLPPRATVRELAAREGWPQEAVELYERARFSFRQPFEEDHARSFLERFTVFLRARRRGSR